MSLWDDLSMREKAAMMRVAVKNKMFDIDLIKEAYNSLYRLVSNSEVINPNLYTPSVNLNINPALDYVGNALESISGYEYEGNPLNKLGIDMSFDLGTTGSSMYPNGIKFVKKFDEGGSTNSTWPESYPKSLLPYEDVLNYLKSLNVTIDGLLYAFPWENAVLLLTSRGSQFYAPDNVAKRVADYYELVLNQAYDYDPSLKNRLNSYRLNLYTRDFLILRNAAYNSSILNSPSLAAKVKPNYRDPNKFAEALQYWSSLETPYKKVVVPKKQNEKGQSSLDQSLDSIGSFFEGMGNMLSSVNESGLQLANASKHNLESVQRADRTANLILDSMESSAEQSKNLPGIVYNVAQAAGQENLEQRDELFNLRDKALNSMLTAFGIHGLVGNIANRWPKLAYRRVLNPHIPFEYTYVPTRLGLIAYFRPWNAARSMLAAIALDGIQAFLDPTEGGKLYNVGEMALGTAGLIGFSDVLRGIPKIGPALDATFDIFGTVLNFKDATNFATDFDSWTIGNLNNWLEDDLNNSNTK